jgi:hypothetical protein
MHALHISPPFCSRSPHTFLFGFSLSCVCALPLFIGSCSSCHRRLTLFIFSHPPLPFVHFIGTLPSLFRCLCSPLPFVFSPLTESIKTRLFHPPHCCQQLKRKRDQPYHCNHMIERWMVAVCYPQYETH